MPQHTAGEAFARAEAAHDKMEAHEELCAFRYGSIDNSIRALFSLIWKGVFALIGLLIMGVIGLMVQLWQVQVVNNRPQAIAISTQPAAPAAPAGGQ